MKINDYDYDGNDCTGKYFFFYKLTVYLLHYRIDEEIEKLRFK